MQTDLPGLATDIVRHCKTHGALLAEQCYRYLSKTNKKHYWHCKLCKIKTRLAYLSTPQGVRVQRLAKQRYYRARQGTLSDDRLRYRLRKEGHTDPTPELVEIKRALIKIKRISRDSKWIPIPLEIRPWQIDK